MKKTIALLVSAVLNLAFGATLAYISVIVFMNAMNDGYGPALWAAVAVVFLACAVIVVVNALLMKLSGHEKKPYILINGAMLFVGLIVACIFFFENM